MNNQPLPGVKLSPDSQKMLEWFSRGHTADICTSAGRCLGDLVLSAESPVHSAITTINTLLQYPLLQQKELVVLGLRWTRLSYQPKPAGGDL